MLLFWSLDRLTREGTLATLKYLELIESCGVHWRSLTEPWIDSAGPFRDVIISLLASLAKQERSGSQNEFGRDSHVQGSMELAAEGQLADRRHCSGGIRLLNFERRGFLGGRSRKQSA